MIKAIRRYRRARYIRQQLYLNRLWRDVQREKNVREERKSVVKAERLGMPVPKFIPAYWSGVREMSRWDRAHIEADARKLGLL